MYGKKKCDKQVFPNNDTEGIAGENQILGIILAFEAMCFVCTPVFASFAV